MFGAAPAMPAPCAGSACTQQVNNRFVTSCEDGSVISWCASCYAADQDKRGGKLGIVKNPDKLCVQCGEKWARGGMRLADGTALRMCSGCAGGVGGSVASQQCTTPGCRKQIRWNVKDADGRPRRLCVSCAQNDEFDVPRSSHARCEVCCDREATYGAQPAVGITKFNSIVTFASASRLPRAGRQISPALVSITQVVCPRWVSSSCTLLQAMLGVPKGGG